MIDTKKEIVKALSTIGLKVYNERFVNSQTAIPCITYLEYDNNVLANGDTIGYSNIIYHVKIWGKDLQTLTDYSEKIDTIMRGLGFKRTNMVDLWLDDVGQRQLKYEGKALENFDKGDVN